MNVKTKRAPKVVPANKELNEVYGLLPVGARILRALNNKKRRAILELLMHYGECDVTTVYIDLRMVQSVASQQLAILRDQGIVDTRRDGKYIYYRVTPGALDHLKRILQLFKHLKQTHWR